MELKDIIRSQTSYNWAVRYLHEGRITQRTFDKYCFLWDWGAARFSGSAAIKQERFYNRFGKDAYWRRIDRVANIIRSMN